MNETKFLDESFEEVKKARQTLKWAYCMLHYKHTALQSWQQNQFFKFKLGELELACENTHQILEADVLSKFMSFESELSEFLQFKQNLMSKTAVLRAQLEGFLQDSA